MSIQIGTSGWHYEHWVGPFYPADLKPEEMLSFYSSSFSAVEINNSFYRLPTRKSLGTWKHSTPDGFVFVFKASRYITHMKKLHDAGDALERMLASAGVLGEKLGPVLFQLPPKWRVNAGRLDSFLSQIPEDMRVAFEFRDPSWFVDDVFASLRRHGAAFCIYELAGSRSPNEITTDFVYIRLHGPGGAYEGSYGTQTLSGWAGAISSWARGGKDVYCFFDNDERGYAVQNAGELRAMLE